MASTITDISPLLCSAGSTSDQEMSSILHPTSSSASSGSIILSLAKISQEEIEVYNELRDRAVAYYDAAFSFSKRADGTITMKVQKDAAAPIFEGLQVALGKFTNLATKPKLENIHQLMCKELRKRQAEFAKEKASQSSITRLFRRQVIQSQKLGMLEEDYKLKALEACIRQLNPNRAEASNAAGLAKVEYMAAQAKISKRASTGSIGLGKSDLPKSKRTSL